MYVESRERNSVADLEEEDEEEEEEEEPVDADLRINMFPPPPEGKLFEIDDERDDVAHERICELVDDTLASAPRRTDVLRKVCPSLDRPFQYLE